MRLLITAAPVGWIRAAAPRPVERLGRRYASRWRPAVAGTHGLRLGVSGISVRMGRWMPGVFLLTARDHRRGSGPADQPAGADQDERRPTRGIEQIEA